MELFRISKNAVALLLIAFILISCKDNKKINVSQKASETTQIVDNYLQIKNALYEDNKEEAAKWGNNMLKAFLTFNNSKLTDSKQKEYTKIAESAEEHIKHIIAGPIEHQRKHFKALSSDIKKLIVLVGTEKTIYQDFCPMYNDGNGKGAIWLSEFKEIKNPYYGNNSKYLSCGSKQKKL